MRVAGSVLLVVAALSASGLAQKMKGDPTLVYIGTYTGAPGASGVPGASKGIYLFRL
jgi:hypothetical protein